jgi:outer membrane biosynthesis protein TonB
MQLFRDVLNVYLITDSGEEIIVENSDDIISHDGIFGVEFSQWYESEEYQAKKNQEVAILQGLTEPQAEKSPVPKKPIPPKTPVQPVKPKKPKAPKPPDKPIDTTTPAKTQSQKQRKSKIYKSGYNSVTQTAKPSLLGRIAQQKQKLKQKEAQKAAKAVSK